MINNRIFYIEAIYETFDKNIYHIYLYAYYNNRLAFEKRTL